MRCVCEPEAVLERGAECDVRHQQRVMGRAHDYSYSDWTAPYRTPAGRDAILAAYGTSFDPLLGRRSYDIWSGFWPRAPSGPMADGLNAATKYVATHRPESLEWGPFEGLGPDIAGDIRDGVERVTDRAFCDGTARPVAEEKVHPAQYNVMPALNRDHLLTHGVSCMARGALIHRALCTAGAHVGRDVRRDLEVQPLPDPRRAHPPHRDSHGLGQHLHPRQSRAGRRLTAFSRGGAGAECGWRGARPGAKARCVVVRDSV